MIDALLFSVNAVFPILLICAFGFYVRNNGTVSDEFLRNGNKFCFNYAFMAMMFSNVYQMQSFTEIRWNVVLFAVLGVMVLFVIGLPYVIFCVPKAEQKGVMHQAFYRSNYATIGLPLAFNIAGAEGLQLASLISAFSVPLFNILGVISLSAFSDQKQEKPVLFVIKSIVKNPLIQGVALGLVCVGVRPFCHDWTLANSNLRFIYKAVESLGSIAPWLSLVILGGQFKFSAVKRLLKEITVSVVARCFMAPVIGMLLVMFLPAKIGLPAFKPVECAALFALYAAPEAVASVAMADQMNADSELAGQILVWTALFSALSLFLFVAFFRKCGIF